MKHLYLASLLISSTTFASLTPDACLDIHRAVGVSMTDAMVKDFGIQEMDIDLDSTEITLLSQHRVTEPLAELYARQSFNAESTHFFSEKTYQDIYQHGNASNIIVKYDYVNRDNKHNIMLASLLINDDECSVRFNGYIIVKREF